MLINPFLISSQKTTHFLVFDKNAASPVYDVPACGFKRKFFQSITVLNAICDEIILKFLHW